MDRKTIIDFCKGMAPPIREYVAEKLAPIEGRLTEIEQRLAAIEKRLGDLEALPAVKYAGVFKLGKSYKAANLATHAGGLWLAKRNTTAQPGKSDAWQLVVKSGRAK